MDNSSQATILVVDDSPTNRLLLVTVLGYAGHHVIEAADGAEALEIARTWHPDLVITDIVMPNMGGAELIRGLRADPVLAHIPVIFYTASTSWDDAWALAESCGVSAVIGKGAEPQVIFDAVALALEQNNADNPAD